VFELNIGDLILCSMHKPKGICGILRVIDYLPILLSNDQLFDQVVARVKEISSSLHIGIGRVNTSCISVAERGMSFRTKLI